MKDLGLSDIRKQEVNKIINQVRDVTQKNFDTKAESVINALTDSYKKQRTNKLKTQKKKAQANVKKGTFGKVPENLAKMLRADESVIPEELVSEYEDVLNTLSKRQSIANIKSKEEYSDVLAKVDNVVEKINNEVGIVEETKSEEEIQKEIEAKDEKYQEALTNAKGKKVKSSKNFTEDEKAIVDSISKFTSKDLGNLSTTQLNNYVKAVDAINAGFLPAKAQELNVEVKANREVGKTEGALERLKGGFLRKSIIGKRAAFKRARASTLDSSVGLKGNALSTLVRPFNVAYTERDRYVNEIINQMTRAFDKVAPLDIIISNKKVTADIKNMFYGYALHKEANPNSKEVHSVKEFIDATFGENFSSEGKKDTFVKKMGLNYYNTVKKLYNKYKDSEGEVSSESVVRDMSKKEKDIYKQGRAVFDSLSDKIYKSKVLDRGEQLKTLEEYVHYQVIPKEGDVDQVVGNLLSDFDSQRPSTRAGTGYQRTTKANPVTFSFYNSVNEAAGQTLTDYYLTEPLKVEMKTVSRLKKKFENSENAGIVNDVLDGIIKQRKELLVSNAARQSQSAVLNYVQTSATRYLLGKGTRAIAETSVNLLRVMANDLTSGKSAFLQTVKNFKDSDVYTEAVRNLQTTQKERLLGNSKFAGYADVTVEGDTPVAQVGSKRTADKTTAAIMRRVSRLTGVEQLQTALVSIPDKIFSRGVFFDELQRVYKKETGTELDLTKLKDGEFKRENKEALDKATQAADEAVAKLFSTTSKAEKSINELSAANRGGLWNRMKYFMLPFIINESQQLKKAVVNNGALGVYQAGVPIAVGIAGYQILNEAASQLLIRAIDQDDDFEEDLDKTLESLIKEKTTERALISTLVELALLREMNGVYRLPANSIIEVVNRNYGEGITREEGSTYNAYRDNIVYNKIDLENLNKVGAFDLASIAAPQFSPVISSISDADKGKLIEDVEKIIAGEKIKDSKNKEEAKQYYRTKALLTLLSALGWLPRDLRDYYVYKEKSEQILKGR